MQKYALGNLVIVLSTGGYASGGSPPNRRSKCFANCTAGDSTSEPVTHHLILAHAAAVKVYREKFQLGIALPGYYICIIFGRKT
ncbi:hypothetical protein AAZV13_11G121100 [Glycine max]